MSYKHMYELKKKYLKLKLIYDDIKAENERSMKTRYLTHAEWDRQTLAKDEAWEAMSDLLAGARTYMINKYPERMKALGDSTVDRMYRVSPNDLPYYWIIPNTWQAKLLNSTLSCDFDGDGFQDKVL